MAALQLDLHVHTRYSFDCRMEPAKVLAIARRRGLDGLAITDHETIEGALEARRLAADGFLVIVGEEITTRAGDIIGLFLTEPIHGRDPVEVIGQIHAQGGLALLPHPFSKTLGIDTRSARELDACEGFNWRYWDGQESDETTSFALEYDLTLVGSSDAHRYRDIGRGRTIVSDGKPEAVREALKEGRTTFTMAPPTSWERAGYALADALEWVVDPIPERQLYHHEGGH